MQRFRTALIELFDFVSFLVFVGGIVLFVRFFLFNPYTVQGSSMMSTIHDGDVIIVDKISSQFRDYQRGDIIVFVPPGQDNPFIKRIVWLPGETVKISSGSVYLCDDSETSIDSCSPLDESYLDIGLQTELPCGSKGKTTLVADQTDSYIVFGDNRPGSTDSRCCFLGHGCSGESPYLAPTSQILWRAAVRLFPLNQMTRF